MKRFPKSFVILSVVLPLLALSFRSPSTLRVSIDSNGVEGNDHSNNAALSPDGRFVAFHSWSDNLVPGDTNMVPDVFMHDRITGVTTRISVDSKGAEGNGVSYFPDISTDGNFVTFESEADNLVEWDTNNTMDIFVHENGGGKTSRVSVATNGTEGNGGSAWPSISADGRYVAFQSDADNLAPGDMNGLADIFVHDRASGETVLVSLDSNGWQGNGSSFYPSISADGRFVAFQSDASNLVPNDANGFTDIFVHDRLTGTTRFVSISSNGGRASEPSENPAISANGRFVAFESLAPLVPNDTNGILDIFVHELGTGETTRVSVSSSGDQGNGCWTRDASISADGRYVAFESSSDNLVPRDKNGQTDIFIHDRTTRQTIRASFGPNGSQGNDYSWLPSLSADGSYVAFESRADNFVTYDTNQVADIFLREVYFSPPEYPWPK